MAHLYYDDVSEKKKTEMPIRPGGLPKVTNPNKPTAPAGNKGSSGGGHSYASSDVDYYPERSSGGSTGSAYLQKLLDEQRAAAAAELRARRQAANDSASLAEDNLNSAYGLSTDRLHTSADDALRQMYIKNQQDAVRMPQQIALMGAGGLSESSLMSQQAGYINNRSAVEQDRLAALSELEVEKQRSLADIEATRLAGELQSETDYQGKLYGIADSAAQREYERQAMLEQRAYQSSRTADNLAQQSSGKGQFTMSYAQYLEALKNGYTGPAVDQAQSVYGTLNVPGQSISSAATVSRNPYYQQSYTSPGKESVIRNIRNSNLSEAQALAELAAAGVTQADILAYNNKYGYNRYTGAR